MPPFNKENNPFAGYRNPVESTRFVGRNKEIDSIRQRVLVDGNNSSSVAILGEAYIGKTSFMKYVFTVEPKLQERKIIIIDVSNIGRFDEAIKFFRHIIKRSNEELLKQTGYSIGSNFPCLTSSDFVEVGMFEFLQRVKEMGYRLVFLLDEFQNIQIPFGKSPEAYHVMHTMIEGSQYKVSCVATVRGNIEEIQKSATKGFSTLISKFEHINFSLMSSAEIRSLIDHRLSCSSLQMTEQEVQILIRNAGLHPHFVDMIGFNWFVQKKEGSNNAMVEAIAMSKSEIFSDFAMLRTRLGKERFDRLIELANNKIYEPAQDGELVRLGHLVENCDAWGNRVVQPFSELYTEYLKKHDLPKDHEASADNIYPEQTKLKKQTRKSKRKILLLALEPIDKARLRLGKEFEEIKKELRLGRNRDKFEITEVKAAGIKDISRALLDIEPNIVHISGHGDADGNLLFEKESGESQAVTPEMLSEFLKLSSNSIECVLLNTCYSKQQANVIANHVQFVIGMPEEISDPASIAFSVGFYQALSAARPFEIAYGFGCAQHGAHRTNTELKPILFVHGKFMENLSI